MAIIDDLGLEVKILVDGSVATEYIPDEETQADGDSCSPSTKICCRYVESIDDAHFAIYAGLTSENKAAKKWIKKSRNNGCTCKKDISVDGKDISGFVVDGCRRGGVREGNVDTVTNTIRKFRFASISTGAYRLAVDDANRKRVAEDLKTAKNLGLIRVVVQRGVIKDRDMKIKTSSFHGTHGLTEGGLSLAEEALKGKAISHGTVDSPLAVFYFMYRSKEALQQELIIPRPRSQSMGSDVDNLSAEELRRLARERLSQMRGNNKRAVSVKEEKDEAPRSSRPFKFVKIEGGKKAIDLTEDD